MFLLFAVLAIIIAIFGHISIEAVLLMGILGILLDKFIGDR